MDKLHLKSSLNCFSLQATIGSYTTKKPNFLGLGAMVVGKTRDIYSYRQEAKQWRVVMTSIRGLTVDS